MKNRKSNNLQTVRAKKICPPEWLRLDTPLKSASKQNLSGFPAYGIPQAGAVTKKALPFLQANLASFTDTT